MAAKYSCLKRELTLIRQTWAFKLVLLEFLEKWSKQVRNNSPIDRFYAGFQKRKPAKNIIASKIVRNTCCNAAKGEIGEYGNMKLIY